MQVQGEVGELVLQQGLQGQTVLLQDADGELLNVVVADDKVG